MTVQYARIVTTREDSVQELESIVRAAVDAVPPVFIDFKKINLHTGHQYEIIFDDDNEIFARLTAFLVTNKHGERKRYQPHDTKMLHAHTRQLEAELADAAVTKKERQQTEIDNAEKPETIKWLVVHPLNSYTEDMLNTMSFGSLTQLHNNLKFRLETIQQYIEIKNMPYIMDNIIAVNHLAFEDVYNVAKSARRRL